MGKHEKLLARLTSRPKDFTFQEVTALLVGFGYMLDQSGSGSRVKFEHGVNGDPNPRKTGGEADF